MNYLIALVLVLTSISAKKCDRNIDKTDTKTTSVQIAVTSTSSYCGGMRPTPEMISDLKVPKPLPGIYYIKKGSTNNLDNPVFKTVTTNDKGIISIDLPHGTYCLVNSLKKDKAVYDAYAAEAKNDIGYYKKFDAKCYEIWFAKPDLIFTVSDTSKNFKTNYHKKCFFKPCMTYEGPHPP